MDDRSSMLLPGVIEAPRRPEPWASNLRPHDGGLWPWERLPCVEGCVEFTEQGKTSCKECPVAQKARGRRDHDMDDRSSM